MGSRLNRRTGLAALGAVVALVVAGAGIGLAVTRPWLPSGSGEPSTGAIGTSTARTATPYPSGLGHSPGAFVWSAEARMIDKNTGWVLAEGRLLKTDDGANTWRDITPPGSGWIEAVEFLDGAHGWCLTDGPSSENPTAGGRIFRTADGGRTWLDTPLPAGRWAHTGALNAVSASIVYALLPPLNDTVANPVWQLYVSHDGGATWQWVAEPATANTGLEVAFGTERDGLIWGSGWMLQSHDGGTTWSPIATPASVGGSNVSLWDPVSVRVFGTSVVMEAFIVTDAGERSNVVYDSADAGRTWRLAVDARSTWGKVNTLWDAADTTAWHYYTDGQIGGTRDAGRTWATKSSIVHLDPQMPPIDWGIDSISFADADNGWAVVQWQFTCTPAQSPCPNWEPGASLAVTRDGGDNWWMLRR